MALPPFFLLPGAQDTKGRDAARIAALFALPTAQAVALSAETLFAPLPPPRELFALAVTLDTSVRITPGELALRLVSAGYESVPQCEEPGQFSLRGGIVDVYLDNGPVRLEFFDNEIDSLRRYDPLTQRSVERLTSVTILPASLNMPGANGERVLARLQEEFAQQEKKLARENKERAREHFSPLLQGQAPFADQLLPNYFTHTLFDYLPSGTLVVLDEPHRLQSHLEVASQEYAELFSLQLAAGAVLPSGCYQTDYAALSALCRNRPLLTLQALVGQGMDITPKAVFTIASRGMQSFFGNPALLAQELTAQLVKKATVLLCAREDKARRLQSELELLNVYCDRISPTETPGPGLHIVPVSVSHGFEYTEAGFMLIGEEDIFHREQKKPAARRKTVTPQAFTELTPGDYAVHDTAGIGLYKGMTQLPVNGRPMDFLTLEYQDGDKLYVPVEQMDRVQKYVGGEDTTPRLHKLGSGQWAAAKARARRAVEDMTEQLVALYREREAAVGFAFSPDTGLQQQFEEDFPYEETPDQLECTKEIKLDMESPRVMDRLLCGDVGYGKTEVALRAAFKAIMDGKQVALLAPTTILAQQHFNTIQNRFSGYAVTADCISRFRSPREQRRILSELKAGNLDLIVGTHRLLGKDVKFADLGLLIIDEEQRFGVAHKERIKEWKTSVDVLSLSATPIPRTLNMSFTGIRDMSVIETPPENRYPVQTFVQEYNEPMLADAIRRELARGGQVFFVHNRIEGLENIAGRLRALVPNLRLAIAHGQMPPERLEPVMLDFYNGQYDLLLSTAIIENGLDMPRVNTIIVNDAHRFGLSQLYQLRGRVGRSNRMAYAYFFYRKNRELTEIAHKRLDAIRDFTAFGSGFKIAMRDLELRGAGNLLGREQSGHMAAVGYEMYTRLVKETVDKIKGKQQAELPETQVDIQAAALLPDDYIKSEAQRLAFYKRIAVLSGTMEAEDLLDELIDRYGEPPGEVSLLIDIALLRAFARRAGARTVQEKPDALVGTFYPLDAMQMERLFQAVAARPGKCALSAGSALSVSFPKKGVGQAALVAYVKKFMEEIMNKT